MSKIINTFPGKRCTMSNYTMRNYRYYCLPKCRLQEYKSSLVPTIIDEWDSLPPNIRELYSLKTLTHAITSDDNISNAKKTPPLYFFLH